MTCQHEPVHEDYICGSWSFCKHCGIPWSQAMEDLEQSPELRRYKQLLAQHDWTYEYSDDYRVWSRGRDEEAEILNMAAKVDPGLTIYKTYSRRN